MERRAGRLAIVLICGLSFAPRGVLAENFDARLLDPVASPHALIGVHSARPLAHLEYFGGVTFDYARDVLLGVAPDGGAARPIAHRVAADVGVALGLFERLDLALSLPVYLTQGAEDDPARGAATSATGIGDLRFAPKVTLLHNASFAGFGLALVAEATAPTGSRGERMGDASFTFTPRVVLDFRLASGFVVALNGGYRVRQHTETRTLAVDDEVRLGLGVEVPLRFAGLALLAEVDAALAVGAVSLEGERDAERQSPVELLGAVRWRHGSGFTLTAGAGAGLTEGYGAPDLRLLVALAFAPGAAAEPASGPAPLPSVAAAAPGTAPPTGPGPAPAAAPPPTAALSAAAFDAAVESDPDTDGDGVPLSLDRCPDQAEDRDDFEDEDGCPDDDNDRDGVPDGADRCRDEKEVVNGVDDDDGCPDEGQGGVVVTADRIEIRERILFETGSDVLRPESHAILRQVAATLKAWWMVRRVLVEGHTDDEGDREMNVDLSERRAWRVLAFLVEEGVAPWRLEAKGFGPTQPLVPNDTGAHRATNRRVEFTILEVLPAGGDPPASDALPAGGDPPAGGAP